MSVDEVLDVLNDHDNWCGTYYGRNWKYEHDVLKTCKSAIEFQLALEEKTNDDPLPDDLKPVLVLFSGTDSKGLRVLNDTGIAWYAENVGWNIISHNMAEFEIHRWRHMPEWSK